MRKEIEKEEIEKEDRGHQLGVVEEEGEERGEGREEKREAEDSWEGLNFHLD